jgi:NDP-sugar pyrophosphorylase family protein
MKDISVTPKVLLPVNGKPILEHAISKLVSYGAKKIFISVGESLGEIDNWIEDNLSRYGLVKVADRPGTNGNFFGVLQSINYSIEISLLAFGDTIFDMPIGNMLTSQIQSNKTSQFWLEKRIILLSWT